MSVENSLAGDRDKQKKRKPFKNLILGTGLGLGLGAAAVGAGELISDTITTALSETSTEDKEIPVDEIPAARFEVEARSSRRQDAQRDKKHGHTDDSIKEIENILNGIPGITPQHYYSGSNEIRFTFYDGRNSFIDSGKVEVTPGEANPTFWFIIPNAASTSDPRGFLFEDWQGRKTQILIGKISLEHLRSVAQVAADTSKKIQSVLEETAYQRPEEMDSTANIDAIKHQLGLKMKINEIINTGITAMQQYSL